MRKRILTSLLAICLLLSSVVLHAHAERTVTVDNKFDLYAAFTAAQGKLKIPADTYLEINGDLSVDETVIVEEGAEVIVGEDVQITANLENNGFLEINPGAVLSPKSGGTIVNNGSLNVYDGATLDAADGSLTNDGYLLLYGKLFCSADGKDGKSRFVNHGEADCDDESKIIFLQADHEHPADLIHVIGAAQLGGTVFAEANSPDELIKLNNSKTVGGVFLNAPSPAEPITLSGDLTVTKPLWVNCDLELMHGSTLTVNSSHQNLLFSRGGRIVCGESGGCLILDNQPVFCGTACTAPLCPVSGKVFLSPDQTAEERYYPLPAQEIAVGSAGEACARGTLPDEMDLGVRVCQGGVLTLCYDFSCSIVNDDGSIDTNGYTLDCGVINYGANSQPTSGNIKGEALYELAVDLNDGSPVIRTFAAAGDRVYLEYIDVDCDSLTEEDGFLGWEASSPWHAAPTVSIVRDTDEASYDYGWNYLIMPAYPLTVTAKRAANIILGDADCDGEVTVTDVTAVQRWLADMPAEQFSETAADVDTEDGVTVLDATLIARFAAGIDTPYPIGESAADCES